MVADIPPRTPTELLHKKSRTEKAEIAGQVDYNGGG